ncbi:hypothetical protein M427DRAFT_59852 [Gonapodya prolifera JEL478]|uniref:Uncharacterized protein n=1 Tax=Gonapodya prolifera (strain JEL478) TaxID=1344416 RepID=A0A139A5G9_GONPJ|nr:hypothetical protein M427DRAFT_59852 [Gonapodya prolifera JEL478]|eukprot:KXS11981.1 hypothetical protein M427DRAFT_59852 [Gonapodya prolifera JEL478]
MFCLSLRGRARVLAAATTCTRVCMRTHLSSGPFAAVVADVQFPLSRNRTASRRLDAVAVSIAKIFSSEDGTGDAPSLTDEDEDSSDKLFPRTSVSKHRKRVWVHRKGRDEYTLSPEIVLEQTGPTPEVDHVIELQLLNHFAQLEEVQDEIKVRLNKSHGIRQQQLRPYIQPLHDVYTNGTALANLSVTSRSVNRKKGCVVKHYKNMWNQSVRSRQNTAMSARAERRSTDAIFDDDGDILLLYLACNLNNTGPVGRGWVMGKPNSSVAERIVTMMKHCTLTEAHNAMKKVDFTGLKVERGKAEAVCEVVQDRLEAWVSDLVNVLEDGPYEAE